MPGKNIPLDKLVGSVSGEIINYLLDFNWYNGKNPFISDNQK